VRFPVDDDNDEPWRLPPSRRTADPPVRDKTLPERVKVVLGNQVYVDRSALPTTERRRAESLRFRMQP
jgi:hypothetical protein